MSARFTPVVVSIAMLLIAAPAAAAQTIDVSTSGADAPSCGTGANPACLTIQYAIDNVASNGDTISVGAGTYDVTSTVDVDKDLTIDGAGDGIGSSGTTVEVPSNSTGLQPNGAPDPSSGCAGDYSVLYIGPAGSGSTIENLTVNGNDDGNPGQTTGGNYPFIGLDIYDANATVDGVQVSGAEEYPFGGGQCTADLQDNDDNGGTQTLTAENLNLNNYQKNGAGFWGTGLTADVSDSTITGVGPTPHLAANGIVYVGAGGSVTGSTITGNECDESACGPDEYAVAQSTGIEAFESAALTVSGDTLDNNDTGMFYGFPDSGTATVSDSVFNDNRYQGLLLNQGTTNASGDEFSGSEFGVQVLSFAQNSDPPDSSNAIANLTNDVITGNTDGIEADDDVTSSPTVFPVITAHDDQITGNSTAGFENDVQVPQNATNNYWGCPSGPGKPGCDSIGGVGAAMVSYLPFTNSTSPLPPAITAAFGQRTTGLGHSTRLTFTITNPNSSTPLTGVGFTDTLPAGLQVATPNGLAGACGSGTITATPGSSSISLTGATLAVASNCTFSVNVTAKTTGSKTDTTSAVTSNEGGSGNKASASTTVVGSPTVSLLVPRNGGRYAFGQVVLANYSCHDAANGPGISSCHGTAPDGTRINTTTAGKDTFTVTATSRDGLTAQRSVTYTVRPDNRFTVSHIKTSSSGSVAFNYVVPAKGKLRVLVSAKKSGAGASRAAGARGTPQPAPGRIAVALVSHAVNQAGSGSLVVQLNQAGQKLLKNSPHGLPIHLWVTYTPSGGTAHSEGFLDLRIPG
jgi:uncharacterized repeat protein (TIGR01451 family)